MRAVIDRFEALLGRLPLDESSFAIALDVAEARGRLDGTDAAASKLEMLERALASLAPLPRFDRQLDLAESWRRLGRPREGRRLANGLEERNAAITDPFERVFAKLGWASSPLLRADYDQACALAEAALVDCDAVDAEEAAGLRGIAARILARRDVGRALEVVRGISSPLERAEALRALLEDDAAPAGRDLVEAVAAEAGTFDGPGRCLVLVASSRRYQAIGLLHEARFLLPAIDAAAESCVERDLIHAGREQAALLRAQLGLVEEALAYLADLPMEARPLALLASGVAASGAEMRRRFAERFAKTPEALAAIAPAFLDEAARGNDANEAERWVQALPAGRAQAEGWLRLGDCGPLIADIEESVRRASSGTQAALRAALVSETETAAFWGLADLHAALALRALEALEPRIGSKEQDSALSPYIELVRISTNLHPGAVELFPRIW